MQGNEPSCSVVGCNEWPNPKTGEMHEFILTCNGYQFTVILCDKHIKAANDREFIDIR